jgi:hypothetical protein
MIAPPLVDDERVEMKEKEEKKDDDVKRQTGKGK